MHFLLSIGIITILYTFLLVYAYKSGFIDIGTAYGCAGMGVDYIIPTYLFCFCYHIFIIVFTIGTASFSTYFIPCLILFIIITLCTIHEITTNS